MEASKVFNPFMFFTLLKGYIFFKDISIVFFFINVENIQRKNTKLIRQNRLSYRLSVKIWT